LSDINGWGARIRT